MIWRDLLYFSTGEKRALIVLIGLILSTTAVLTLCSRQKEPAKDEISLLKAEHKKLTKGFSAKIPQITADSSYSEKQNTLPPSPPKGKRRGDYTPHKSYPERYKHNTSYPILPKYEKGTLIELNNADTTSLKKVPGIGSTFANRIVKFRLLLGGFYSVEQLKEVYGMTEEKYADLKGWFTVKPARIKKLQVNKTPKDSLNRHPYLNYQQTRILIQLREQNGKLSGWNDLTLLEEFGDTDKTRLNHYLSFE